MDRLIHTQFYRLKIRQNYRQAYDQATIDGIARSILTEGFKIEYPIVAYKQGDEFIIISGHTRYFACEQVSQTVHSKMFGVWIALKDKPDDKTFKLDQLAENSLRQNPDPISEAIGYKQAIDAGATIEELSNATGKYRAFIEDRLSLLSLIDTARDMVAKRHLGVKFAAQLTRLDNNFQLIALKAYNAMKSPTLDEFSAIVGDLYTKQSQCSMFDLALFNGKPIEELIESINVERAKTRQELLDEIAALKKIQEQDRAYAIRKYKQDMSKALQTIAQLQAKLQKAG